MSVVGFGFDSWVGFCVNFLFVVLSSVITINGFVTFNMTPLTWYTNLR